MRFLPVLFAAFAFDVIPAAAAPPDVTTIVQQMQAALEPIRPSTQQQSIVFRKELSWTGDAPSVPPLLNSGSIGRITVVPSEVPGDFHSLFVVQDNLYHKRIRDFEILHGRNPVTAKDGIGGNDSAPPISKRDL